MFSLPRLGRPALVGAFVLSVMFTAACGDSEPEAADSGKSRDRASDTDDDSSDADEGSADEDDSRASMRDAGTGRDGGSAVMAKDAAALDGATRTPGSLPPARADATSARPTADASAPMTIPVAGDGGSVSGISADELEQLRKVCVDEINMYRATLMLAPIPRASAAQELCSDQGAMKDGTSKKAHSSAGRGSPCFDMSMPRFPGFSSQNTCPDYPVGGRGAPTIADALKGCLKQMWAEGEPPVGEAQCIADYRAGNTACFLAHGHYLNMKNAARGVSCGFFHTGNNRYWMNQDFL